MAKVGVNAVFDDIFLQTDFAGTHLQFGFIVRKVVLKL